MAAQQTLEKPGMVTAIGIMMIISGVGNIILSITITITVAITLIGLLCVPITILPIILGVFEIIYGIKILGNPPNKMVPPKIIAIFEIVDIIFLNVFSVVTGILALVFYNDEDVIAYFEAINQ